MKRAEHEMARFRGFNRDGDRFQIAHLPHQDDIGIFTKRGPQRRFERIGVGADLPLVDQALLILMDELDRVLDGDDVLLTRTVDVIDHRAERRRLAGPGRPCDKDEALVQLAEIQNRR